MKNSMRMFILTEAFLAIMLIMTALVMFWERNGQATERIAVIIQDSDSDQWSAFRYGLRAAAEDQDMDVFVVSTEKHLSAEEEMRLISYEKEYGADAVIVQPAPGIDMEEVEGKSGRDVPLMLVNCRADEEDAQVLPSTGSDDYAMGADLVKGLLEDSGGRLEGKTIGLVSELNGFGIVDNRETGFRSALEGTGGEIVWSVNVFSGDKGEISLEELPAVDFVVALDDRSLVEAGKESAANNLHGALVYGIGNSTEAVYYLDMGDVKCLVVTDDFNLGYQSLTEVAKRLTNRFYKMKGNIVSHTVLRREELFLKENQEILFTMNQ